MKYYIVAGERSGDLHGGNLIREITKLDPDAQIRCWGGDEMENAGGVLVKHYRDLAFMGFWEVFKNLLTIRGFLKQCQSDLLEFQPDAVILIDYAGFNLRIARFAKENNFRVHYYIAPKTWAWNASRTHKLRKYTDRVFSILPFESEFFRSYGVNATYVGNPLKDAIRGFQPDYSFRERYQIDDKLIIALLPGSRKQEIQNVLNTLLQVVPAVPEAHFVVAAVGNLPPSFYNSVRSHNRIRVVTDETYQVLSQAHLAIVTSGTATLETALFGVPQVVVYKTSYFTYRIARALIRVPYISLINLIMDEEIVPELIQHDFTAQKVNEWLQQLLGETQERQNQLNAYARLQKIVGDRSTSRIVAEQIIGIQK